MGNNFFGKAFFWVRFFKGKDFRGKKPIKYDSSAVLEITWEVGDSWNSVSL